MTTNRKWFLLAACWLSGVVLGAQTATAPVYEVGVVTAISKGALYIGGIPHSIATVDAGRGTKRVAVQTMGVMQPLKVGESLSFAGPYITVNSELIVNTNAGFIFRFAEKSMAEHTQEMMDQAEAQAKEAAKSGIPNAVPIMLMESKEQAEESSYKRRTDLLIAILTLIVTLLAFERVHTLVTITLRQIKSLITKFASKKPLPERQAAKQGAPADVPDDTSPQQGRS